MGTTFAEIKLVNTFDELKARDGIIQEKDVRQVTVSALVDTGAFGFYITEDVHARLGLGVIGEKKVTVAGGAQVVSKIVDPVKIHCQGRYFMCSPRVLPGEQKVILGVIPLEGMDFIVNPVKQCVEGAHGDEWVELLLSTREVL